MFGQFKQMCCNYIKTLFLGMDWQGSGEGQRDGLGDQWASESPAGTSDYLLHIPPFLPA